MVGGPSPSPNFRVLWNPIYEAMRTEIDKQTEADMVFTVGEGAGQQFKATLKNVRIESIELSDDTPVQATITATARSSNTGNDSILIEFL